MNADTLLENFEVLAEAPGGIHHILFEDGHVERVFQDDVHRDDHLFRNDDGKTAAGVDPDDAVIGDSHHQP